MYGENESNIEEGVPTLYEIVFSANGINLAFETSTLLMIFKNVGFELLWGYV
jgi:hypothetical protein